MKRKIWSAALTLATVAIWCVAEGNENKTFYGEIADSQCALNVHSLTRSHQEMLKSKSMGGNSASCTFYCIKYLGGDLVLSSKNNVYRLDDQDEAQKFAGQDVEVTGSLDAKTKKIHVKKIELIDKRGL